MTETLEIIIGIGVILLGVNVLMLVSIIGIWVTVQIQMRRTVNCLKDIIIASVDSKSLQERHRQQFEFRKGDEK